LKFSVDVNKAIKTHFKETYNLDKKKKFYIKHDNSILICIYFLFAVLYILSNTRWLLRQTLSAFTRDFYFNKSDKKFKITKSNGYLKQQKTNYTDFLKVFTVLWWNLMKFRRGNNRFCKDTLDHCYGEISCLELAFYRTITHIRI